MKHHVCPLVLKLIATLCGLAIVLSGCSSSYTVGSGGKSNSEYSYQEMNEELRGRNVNIGLKDGRDISATEVSIFGDSVSWIEERADKVSKANIREINSIVRKSSLVGALEGMGLGLAGGGGIGLIIGSNQHSREIPMGLVGLILGGGVGIIAGLTTGLIVGHSYNYEFPTTEQSDSLQTGR